MSQIRSELNEKLSAIKGLQMELNRGEEEGTYDILKDLKRSVATLEKENATLKVKVMHNSFVDWNVIENFPF